MFLILSIRIVFIIFYIIYLPDELILYSQHESGEESGTLCQQKGGLRWIVQAILVFLFKIIFYIRQFLSRYYKEKGDKFLASNKGIGFRVGFTVAMIIGFIILMIIYLFTCSVPRREHCGEGPSTQ